MLTYKSKYKKVGVLPPIWKARSKGPFTRAIFVAIFLILTHAIEWLSHKNIDLNSFAQMVLCIRKPIHSIACIKRRKIAAKIACVNGPLGCVYTLRLIRQISYPGECDVTVHPRKYSVVFLRMYFVTFVGV